MIHFHLLILHWPLVFLGLPTILKSTISHIFLSCFASAFSLSHCALLFSLSRSATSMAAMLREAVMRCRRLMPDFNRQTTPHTPRSHCIHTVQKRKRWLSHKTPRGLIWNNEINYSQMNTTEKINTVKLTDGTHPAVPQCSTLYTADRRTVRSPYT